MRSGERVQSENLRGLRTARHSSLDLETGKDMFSVLLLEEEEEPNRALRKGMAGIDFRVEMRGERWNADARAVVREMVESEVRVYKVPKTENGWKRMRRWGRGCCLLTDRYNK